MPSLPLFIQGNGVTYSTTAGVVMLVMSLLSALASSTILFAFATVLRKKASTQGIMRVIQYISFSNLLTSLGSIVGEPSDRSAACWFQGLTTNIFTLCSAYWCLDVVLILYFIVAEGYPRIIGFWDHALCWGIPIFVTFLPLINSTFGAPGHLGWCFVVPVDDVNVHKDMQVTWFWVAFYGHVWAVIGASFFLFSRISSHIHSSHPAISQDMLYKIQHQLQLYPLVVMIAWLPGCCVDTAAIFYPAYPAYRETNIVAVFCACSQGLLTTMVFWSTHGEARRAIFAWYRGHAQSAWSGLASGALQVKRQLSINRGVAPGGLPADWEDKARGANKAAEAAAGALELTQNNSGFTDEEGGDASTAGASSLTTAINTTTSNTSNTSTASSKTVQAHTAVDDEEDAQWQELNREAQRIASTRRTLRNSLRRDFLTPASSRVAVSATTLEPGDVPLTETPPA